MANGGNEAMQHSEAPQERSLTDLTGQVKKRLEQGRMCRKTASDILSKDENIQIIKDGFKTTFDKMKGKTNIIDNPNVKKLFETLAPENLPKIMEQLRNEDELNKYLDKAKQAIDSMEPEAFASFIENLSHILCMNSKNNAESVEQQLQGFAINPDDFLGINK